MRTNVREPATRRSRFRGQVGAERKEKWNGATGKFKKPKIINDIPIVEPAATNDFAANPSEQSGKFGWWSLLPAVIVLTAAAVFRKSLVASLAWAGGAVFLGILLVVCAIGFCLCVVWAVNFRRSRKKRGAAFSILFFLISCAMVGISAKYAFNMESNKPEYEQAIVEGIKRNLAPHTEHLIIKFRDGGDWYFEPKRLVGEEEAGVQNPGYFVLAIIAIEDERFLERLEGAVDFRSVGRILWRRLKGKVSGKSNNEGGSTIPMQLAKNLKNDPNSSEKTQLKDRSVTVKIDETIVAQRIDNEFTPEQQLALYANLCDGNYRGMADVAFDLFGVTDLRRLELEQAALLIAIPKSPTAFNPRTNPVKAKERRDLVLGKMKELEFISDEQFQKAVNTKIEVREKGWNAEPSFINALNFGGLR
jgi:hypothetical protein